MTRIQITPDYQTASSKLIDGNTQARIQTLVSGRPTAWPVIRGTAGARKMEVGFRDRGAKRGLRVIYFFDAAADVIVLLTVYDKARKSDLTAAEEYAIKTFIETR